MAAPTADNDGIPAIFHAIAKHRHLIVPVSFLALVGVLVVPLPSAVLDLLLCLNIAIGAIVLMTTIYMRKPLDFSVFPALLLGTTLFRLVLNVASTRLILSIESKDPATATTAFEPATKLANASITWPARTRWWARSSSSSW